MIKIGILIPLCSRNQKWYTIDDIDFIKKLLSDPSKESYLRNWFEDLVKNTTLEGWINAPEGLFRKLSHIFSKEVVKNV